MEDPEQFDGLLMTILQKGQGINNLFDSVFGFLYRKSDFFADKQKSYEFVETNYHKYLKKFEEKQQREEKKKKKDEEEKRKREQQEQKPQSGGASVREITQEEFERRKNEERLRQQEKEKEENNQVSLNSDIKIESPSTENKNEKEEDKLAPGKIKPSQGNGNVTDKYSWTQPDIKEINVTIPVSPAIRGRDLIVKYDAKEFLVQVKGQDPLIKGEFCQLIKADSLVWTLEEVKNGKVITVTFEKFDTYKWWECLIKGEQEIDTTKINPEASKLSDIEDPEMRAQVEKMMFDTRQKSMGLPTSDDMQKNKALEQFMKAHPEMDFSKAKFG